jgi:hypothetical protein
MDARIIIQHLLVNGAVWQMVEYAGIFASDDVHYLYDNSKHTRSDAPPIEGLILNTQSYWSNL